MSEKTLAKKLAAVMASVSHVPKNGRHPTQGYPFATDVDVMAAVRMELANAKIILTHRAESVEWRHTQGKNGPIAIAIVKVAFTAHDGESGESMEVASAYGEGMDQQDKCVPKAITSATKYALLKLFLMPTGDDPEAHDADNAASDHSPRLPTPAQAPRPAGRAAAIQGPDDSPRPLRATASGAVFPFGKSKGQPIRGGRLADLKWVAAAIGESIDNPDKARFRDSNLVTLAALEAEIARQEGANGHGQEAGDVPF